MKRRTAVVFLIGRQQYDSLFPLSIHFSNNRLTETYVPQVLRFVYGRLCVQKVLIIDAVVHKGVDGEVAHTERGQR